MKAAILCIVSALAGCADPTEPHWTCIDGFTYEQAFGAWIRVDGHKYIGYRDGPVKCAVQP